METMRCESYGVWGTCAWAKGRVKKKWREKLICCPPAKGSLAVHIKIGRKITKRAQKLNVLTVWIGKRKFSIRSTYSIWIRIARRPLRLQHAFNNRKNIHVFIGRLLKTNRPSNAHWRTNCILSLLNDMKREPKIRPFAGNREYNTIRVERRWWNSKGRHSVRVSSTLSNEYIHFPLLRIIRRWNSPVDTFSQSFSAS